MGRGGRGRWGGGRNSAAAARYAFTGMMTAPSSSTPCLALLRLMSGIITPLTTARWVAERQGQPQDTSRGRPNRWTGW